MVMNNSESRFEFRIFGTCLGMAEQRMRAIAPCESISESREIYLLEREPSADKNIKIRHGKLELKRLTEQQQGLQRWQPDGQWEFPVALKIIKDLLNTGDRLNPTRDLTATLDQGNLLKLVRDPSAHLLRANVYKCRYRFILPACHAEYDRLLVNGAAIESVAIESVDSLAVLETQAALGLEDFENQSYPVALSRILGISRLPDEETYG
jgi:hypothetical protein